MRWFRRQSDAAAPILLEAPLTLTLTLTHKEGANSIKLNFWKILQQRNTHPSPLANGR